MVWADGAVELDTGKYSASLGLLLDSAIEGVAERRDRWLTEAHLLAELLQLDHDDSRLLSLSREERDHCRNAASLLENYVASGVRVSDCVDTFREEFFDGQPEINPFERDIWREPLPGLLEGLGAGAGIPDLLTVVFQEAGQESGWHYLTELFKVDGLLAALEASTSQRSVFVCGSAEDGSPKSGPGTVDDGAFTSRARFLIDKALALAAKTGAQSCDSATLLIAMLQTKDTYTQLILQRAGVSTTTAAASSYLTTAATESHLRAAPLPAVESSLTPQLGSVLEAALRQARATGGQAAGERELLGALLQGAEPRLRYLVDTVLDIPTNVVGGLLGEVREPEVIEPYLPADICPVRNVTAALARSPETAPVCRDDLIGQIARVFFRRKGRNVLLHGEHGTGASTMAEVLADALRQGLFPALRHMQVIAFDLCSMDGIEYAAAAEKVLAFMESEPDRIYVVEGFGKYFAEHFAACARRLTHNTYRLLICVDQPEYVALQAGSEPLNSFLDELELVEPALEVTSRIVEQAMAHIATEYGVEFADKAAQIAVRMATDYLMSARFPAKAVDLLERSAADVAAESEMTGSDGREVGRRAMARRLASVTGIPVETILGTGQDKDYVDLLSTNIVGQQVAVAKVAGRLDLIQKGLVDKKAPAAVFIFAGLSGTGKTELAKQISQIYSRTHAMISFAMENFGEAHSVSKLIGSPPGYVGFEHGGPLINALNRDPYAVVLLDEIEKAHPAVWDPFLNLFDEGVITDSRGVMASGARAFFVLTSNIGQYEIADMLAQAATQAEIEDAVMRLLPRHQHEQARLPCFRPEFIGRVMRRGGIVAFDALGREALLGIARYGFAEISRAFAEVHEGRFVCDDDVLAMIADTIYTENGAVIRQRRPGYLGARRIQQLLDQYVNNKLAGKIRQVAGAPLVRVVLDGRDTEVIPVYSDADADALIAEKRTQLVGRVERRFSQLVTIPDDAISRLSEERLTRLDRLLSEVGSIV